MMLPHSNKQDLNLFVALLAFLYMPVLATGIGMSIKYSQIDSFLIACYHYRFPHQDLQVIFFHVCFYCLPFPSFIYLHLFLLLFQINSTSNNPLFTDFLESVHFLRQEYGLDKAHTKMKSDNR